MDSSFQVKKCFSKKCSAIAVLAVGAGAAALWFVWFGPSSLINKELVESNLQRLSSQLGAFASEHGKEAKISYGEIEIAGWGYGKKAIVHNPVVEVSVKGEGVSKAWAASTNSVLVESDSVNSGRVILLIADAINISEDGKARETVTFSEPLKYGYLATQIGAEQSAQQDVYIPKKITISQLDASGVAAGGDCANSDAGCASQEGASAKAQTTISFINAPTLQIISSQQSEKSSISYDFSGMEITSNDGNKLIVGTAAGKFNKENEAEGKPSIKYNFTLGDVVVSDATHTSKPYAFNFDVAVSGDSSAAPAVAPAPVTVDGGTAQEPAKTPEVAAASVASSGQKIALNNLSVSGQDFKVHASGNILVEAGDIMPSGLVELKIDNVPQFLSSELVPADSRGLVEGLLEKMAGKPVAKEESISIPLKREKNGTFYLGQANFEALAASALSDTLMGRPASDYHAPDKAAAPVVAPSVAEPTVSGAATAPVAPVVTDLNAAKKTEGAK